MDTTLELFALFRTPLLWCAIVLCIGSGILGLANPEFLRKVNALSAKSVDTERFFSALNTNVNTDQFLLKHARIFGICAIVTSLVLFYQIR